MLGNCSPGDMIDEFLSYFFIFFPYSVKIYCSGRLSALGRQVADQALHKCFATLILFNFYEIIRLVGIRDITGLTYKRVGFAKPHLCLFGLADSRIKMRRRFAEKPELYIKTMTIECHGLQIPDGVKDHSGVYLRCHGEGGTGGYVGLE